MDEDPLKMLQNLPVAIGRERGVKVLWRSEISKFDRKLHIHDRNAVSCVIAEFEVDAEVTDNVPRS